MLQVTGMPPREVAPTVVHPARPWPMTEGAWLPLSRWRLSPALASHPLPPLRSPAAICRSPPLPSPFCAPLAALLPPPFWNLPALAIEVGYARQNPKKKPVFFADWRWNPVQFGKYHT